MSSNQQRFLAIGLNIIVLLLLLLAAYVWLLPQSVTPIPELGSDEAAWWGMWPVKVASGGVFVVAVLVVVGTILYSWRLAQTGWGQEEGKTGRQGDRKSRVDVVSSCLPLSLSPYLLVSALLVVAFFLFPVAHTRWGDAYILSQAIGWPDEALRLTHSWQAPLDVFVHGRVWLFLNSRYEGFEAVDVYRLLSPLAGILYLGVVLALGRQRTLAPAWLTFGLLSSLGLMQLFFGYIENYSFAAAGILAYLWLGIGVLQGEKPLWLAATVLAVTNATHPSTVVLAPSLLYVGWCWYVKTHSAVGPKRRLGHAVIQIAIPMIVVAGATILLMELGDHGLRRLMTDDRPGGGDGRWFVPLFETTTRWELYTMFSWPHLRDFLNEQMLVAPVVLPSLVLVGVRGLGAKKLDTEVHRGAQSYTEEEAGRGSKVERFLLIAALFYLLFVWAWNPDYGGQRDWDLFSLAALPTTLLLCTTLPRMLTERRWLVVGTLPLIVFQALHTAAWIYQNTLPWQWPD